MANLRYNKKNKAVQGQEHYLDCGAIYLVVKAHSSVTEAYGLFSKYYWGGESLGGWGLVISFLQISGGEKP